MSQPTNIVIIGAEAAGMSAAAKAARVAQNATITVFEQSDVISFGACGLPYYIGDFFTNPGEMSEFTPEQFAKRGINVQIRHQVTRIDTEAQVVHVHNLNSDEHFEQPYDQLMIATGATPILPPIEGIEQCLRDEQAFFVKTMNDGLRIKEVIASEQINDVTIIGAGYIGLEVAEAMKVQGKNTRIVEGVALPLSGSFDAEIAEWVKSTLAEEGVECHWETFVQSVEKTADGRVLVRTTQGEFTTDLLMVCTGVRPSTGLAKTIGLQTIDNGAIVTDAQGRTSISNIFAAGDCATVPHAQLNEPRWIALATYANKMGRIVGEVMGGMDKTFPGAYGAAAVKVMNMEAGRVGLGEAEARAAGFDVKTVVIKDKNYTSYFPNQAEIMVKLVYEAGSKKLLGGQVAGGQGAVLRVDALAVAIKSGQTTEDLGMMDFVYAPPFARTWDALNVAGNVAK